MALGSECTKNKRSKEIGVYRKTKRAKKTRVYSVFRVGEKWFKMCYFSKVERRLSSGFTLWDL